MLLPWSVVYGEQYYLPNYATGITFTIVAGISVALRFLTRFLSNVKFSIDDWLVLAAYTFFFVQEVLQLVSLDHRWDNDLVYTGTFSKYVVISTWFYSPTAALLKLAILCYYRRIFDVPRFRTKTWFFIIFTIAWGTAATLSDIFACTPVRAAWDYTTYAPRCINFIAWITVLMGIETILDTAILILPIREVLRLQMDRKRKIAVCGVFLLGSFVIITNFLRVVLNGSAGGVDQGLNVLWINIHAGTAFLSASLPTYAPLVVKLKEAYTSILSSLSSRKVASREYYRELGGSRESHMLVAVKPKQDVLSA